MTVASVSKSLLIDSFADIESRADVGSSTRMTGDFCRTARMMATRCRSPPDNPLLPEPTNLPSPSVLAKFSSPNCYVHGLFGHGVQ